MRAMLAAVVLGGVFGSAAATVEEIDDNGVVIDLTVEVLGSAESVVAHLSFRNERTLTLPLLDRGGGTFGLRTELEPKNYMVVFETIGAAGESSEPVSLAQLGADLTPDVGERTTTTETDDELSDESRRSLWLAIALGAGSLSLLAFWVLGGRDDESAPAAGDEGEPGHGAREEE